MYEISSVDAVIGEQCQDGVVGLSVAALIHVHRVPLNTYIDTNEVDCCKNETVRHLVKCHPSPVKVQVAQLSQRNYAAGWVSFGRNIVFLYLSFSGFFA